MVTGSTPVNAELTQEGLPIAAADDLVSPTSQPGRMAARHPLKGLLGNRKAVVGAIILLIFIGLAIFAPWITRYPPDEFVARPHLGPSTEHWFGTDGSGHDVFSQ